MSDSTTNINDNRNECENELRRGPWTLEEDNLLIEYISCRGEGRWNSLAKFAGLKRTGKSCRLRWLNYLKPDIKRGNLTPHEQLLILELHSKWGNRWSRIAQHLPGRTDNEIKNYWRTKVQKQARQLKLDSNSKNFLEAIRRFWMKKLVAEMEQNTPSTSAPSTSSTNIQTTLDPAVNNDNSGSDLNLTQSEFPIEDEYYNVGFPTCINYDMQEMDNTISQHHVAGTDWFEEDLGSTFWNTDELWQFNKNWD